jgi:hypothetical protein
MSSLNKKSIETPSLQLERPRLSGFVLKPIDTDAARLALRQMADEADAAECQQTLEELMQALDETRAEAGERLLFP